MTASNTPTVRTLRLAVRLPFGAPLGTRCWIAGQMPRDDEARFVLDLSAEGVNELEAEEKLVALKYAVIDALGAA